MYEQIQKFVEENKLEQALSLINECKAKGEYNETLAILEASVYEACQDFNKLYECVSKGLKISPCSGELYYLLGNYYLYFRNNHNQAYLCYENSLHYMNSKEDREYISQVIENLFLDYPVNVNKTAIIIASYNACYCQQKNIESIRDTLPKDSYKIVVVDNASTDGIREWLDEQKDIWLVKNNENKGFAAACNQGVSLIKELFPQEQYDILLLNNDTRLAKNSLFWLRMGLYENDLVGTTGALSNYAGNNQQLELNFDLPMEYLEYGMMNNIPMEYPYEERTRLSGFAMLIRSNVWNIVGGMDEDFTPGYFEDDALSMEITRCGYKLLACRNSFIYHAGSQSFSSDSNVNEYLVNHYKLFIKKYGFDILDLAYADETFYRNLPYNSEDEFNVLELGCGIGADFKGIRKYYPNAHCVGIEPSKACRDIASNVEIILDSIEELTKQVNKHVFHVLIIKDAFRDLFSTFSDSQKSMLMSLCAPGCIILPKDNPYEKFPFSDIKLVVWDLDETFWRGTISEENVTVPEENINLIIDMARKGIISSISSKNDEQPVMDKLEELGLSDYFVFNNINWKDKGYQLKEKIDNMNLRAQNVLFIDDNMRNLEEAKYNCEGLLTALPDVIPYLIEYVNKLNKSDIKLQRLNQYKILEKKTKDRENSTSQKQFLYDSQIGVTINRNCLEEIDRIVELVARTNQLNFTKNRDSKELLTKLVTNDWNDCAYIRAWDKFGDYGIVGFYCYNTREEKMEHFLFSCRVLGMGIEQYIYEKIGCPEFAIEGAVAVQLKRLCDYGDDEIGVDWICEDVNKSVLQDRLIDNRVRILLKGPCDLSAIEAYLSGGNVTTEFNYVNNYGFITTGQNHTMNIWQSAHMTEDEIKEITDEVPFIIKGDFETKIFSEKYHIVCFSLLQDCNAGLYKNKKTGAYISIGNKNLDITDKETKTRFTNGELKEIHGYKISKDELDKFSENWNFVGRITNDDLIRNLEYIYDSICKNSYLVLILGSEIEYEKDVDEFYHLSKTHREVNALVRQFAADKEKIRLINITDYIKSQGDYTDCIDHFSRDVYYQMADDLVGIINEIMK